jgi:hypothetical protein
MAIRDEDVIYRQLVRQARPPANGTRLNTSGAGRMNATTPETTTIVDGDGNVRRLWTPGDDWGDGTAGSSGFYFGGNE